MERKYKDLNNKVHQIDERFTHLLPAGCIEIDDAEAADILKPQPKTQQEVKREAERDELEAVRAMPLIKTMRRMTSAEVLDKVDTAFPAGPQRDLVRQLALIAWASAIERDLDD